MGERKAAPVPGGRRPQGTKAATGQKLGAEADRGPSEVIPVVAPRGGSPLPNAPLETVELWGGSNEQLRVVADALPVLVSYVDADERYRFLNKTYEQWFGRPREAAIGQTVVQVLGEQTYQKVKGSLARALAGERVSALLRANVPALGEREFEVTFTPDFGVDGRVRGSIDLVTDITERRALERHQEENQRRLQSTATRQELLARASREFAVAEPNAPALLQTIAELVARQFGDTAGVTLRRTSGGDGSAEGAGFTVPVLYDRDEQSWAQLLALPALLPPFDGGGSPGNGLSDAVLETLLASPRAVSIMTSGDGASGNGVEQVPIFGEARYRSWRERFPVIAAMAVPLRLAGRATGAVVCTRRSGVNDQAPQPYDEEALSLFQEVADRAAIALENARLLIELNAAKAETDQLYALTDAVNRAESLEGVYAPALDAISRQLEVHRCALLLFEQDGVMRFKAWRGLSESYRQTVEGHSPWGAETRNPRPLLVGDVQQAPELETFRTVLQREGIRSLAFIPVIYQGRLLGKFMVYSDRLRDFGNAEVKLAQTIADQVAAAVGQKQAKAEREVLITQLTKTVRTNELFAGILGHDLRNPLGAILMSATVLSRKDADPTVARTAGRILSAGQRMNRMIAQLLDFTRVRAAGALPIQRSRLDLAIVIQQVVEELPDPAAAPRVRVESLGDTQGWWDPDRLAQAGLNLVTNALRYGHTDGEVLVRIVGEDPSAVTLSVRNVGAVPAHLLPVIWEPFQQGELRERRTGLGLGLFITREIVNAHGGSVTVESTSGETTFAIVLPRGAAAA